MKIKLDLTMSVQVCYDTVEDCLTDPNLAELLDSGKATCAVWCGQLKLTGKPLDGAAALRDLLEKRRKVIEGGKP